MGAIKLYCLSGLGTDKRAFQRIHVEGVELVHVPWIDFKENESLQSYAKRLFEAIQPEDDYNLIGLSFGGMIATEWEKIKAPKTLILLSTMRDKKDLPGYMRVAGLLNLHKIIPMSLLSYPNFISYFLFGITNNENKQVFKDILHDTDPVHLKWAINAIVNWKNHDNSNGIRIHGDKDRLLPMKKGMDHVVSSGGHMIVLNNADEINEIIERSI
ncbi:MAG: pimeloyl-ACP methyl ester carboxylesterase [Crocinitomicaceae bacterium]|jgi:pimeloyl-ACP methyl ester carboxylesterase